MSETFGKRARWAIIAVLRAWEMRQFRQRLASEQAVLGELVALRADAGSEAAGCVPLEPRAALALGQIRFLEREIAWRTSELERERERFFS